MNRAAQVPQGTLAQTCATQRSAPGGSSAGISLRSWWSRPSSKGLTLSCWLHAMLGFGLTLVAWAIPRSSDEAKTITAVFEPMDGRPIQFELSSTELVGGGGGPTPPVYESAFANLFPSLEPGSELRFVPLPIPDAPTADLNVGSGVGRGRGTGQGNGTGSRKPASENAVTEGSFTVWTIPDDPIPGETYTIMIEVKLPDKITRYPRSDLSGVVEGTDGWHQPLPGNARPLQQYLPMHSHTVQLEVDVPGAGRRIRDTIQVRSKLLKEEQVLKIVF